MHDGRGNNAHDLLVQKHELEDAERKGNRGPCIT